MKSSANKSYVKVNEVFSFFKDPHCWHLQEVVSCRDKHGNPSTKINTTYHPSLKKVCAEIIDLSAGRCDTAEEILELLGKSGEELVKALAER